MKNNVCKGLFLFVLFYLNCKTPVHLASCQCFQRKTRLEDSVLCQITFKMDILWCVLHFFFVYFFFPFPSFLSFSSSSLSLFQSVCPDFPAVLLLVSVLFVDVGDEEEAGPLRRFQNSRERCKFLAPSISVSVPEDDPYHSDEEYYEHPLFSPEWTHSGSRPTGQAFRQIEGEPRMVPLCHFPPPFLSLSLCFSPFSF